VHGHIATTVAKAKELRPYVARWVTLAKRAKNAAGADRLALERQLYQRTGNRIVVRALVDDIAVRTASRAGGYTRIIKLQPRVGDGALTARIQFVDGPVASSDSKKKQSRKSTKESA